MFYRYPRDSAQSLMLRTGYALLSGHLTANGTFLRPTKSNRLFVSSEKTLSSDAELLTLCACLSRTITTRRQTNAKSRRTKSH